MGEDPLSSLRVRTTERLRLLDLYNGREDCCFSKGIT
jgi:hypothetical protein